MFVQMSAMSVACTFSSNPALAPLGSRSLLIFSRWRLTVSIVWRSACTAMASIHQACGRMAAPGRTTSGAPVSAGMRAAVGGSVAANNYSPLQSPNRRAPAGRPYAPPFGGASGRASLRAASARASARAAGGGPDAHAIQRPSPVSPRTTRSMRAPAPSDRAGRAHDGTPAEGGGGSR